MNKTVIVGLMLASTSLALAETIPVEVRDARYYVDGQPSEYMGLEIVSKVKRRVRVEKVEPEDRENGKGECSVTTGDMFSRGVEPFTLRYRGDRRTLESSSCKEVTKVRIKVNKVWYEAKVTYSR
jgi:hypothetical protein